MKSKKALIIDDDVDLCYLLRNYLQKHNFTVEIYPSLNQGLTAIKNQKADLVFLDNNLPDGLGWLKIEEITEEFPELQLHLLSGYQYTPQTLNWGKKIKVWQKPVSTNDLDSFFDKATAGKNSKSTH